MDWVSLRHYAKRPHAADRKRRGLMASCYTALQEADGCFVPSAYSVRTTQVPDTAQRLPDVTCSRHQRPSRGCDAAAHVRSRCFNAAVVSAQAADSAPQGTLIAQAPLCREMLSAVRMAESRWVCEAFA